MLPYSSQITEQASLTFRLPYLEYDFLIANLVRLNSFVLRISKTSQEHTCKVECYVSKLAGTHAPL